MTAYRSGDTCLYPKSGAGLGRSDSVASRVESNPHFGAWNRDGYLLRGRFIGLEMMHLA